MSFQFPNWIEAGIAAGKYVQVFNAAGVPISIARDAVTGQFVGHAIGIVNNGLSLNPFFAPFQMILSGVEIYQNHCGFQATLRGIDAIQSSLAVLQSTTAVIGVGTAAGMALSGVNLWQTLKLRQDVKQLRSDVGELKLDIRDGFIDLKQALGDVTSDLQFKQHRLEFAKAYGKFLEATKLLKTAILIQDIGTKKIELANARQTLGESLAIYRNPHLLSQTSAAGKLRRYECAWTIEQAIILSYQLQNEPLAAGDRIKELQNNIRQDCLKVVDSCDREEELEFIFPEIVRIHDNDLIVLEVWKQKIDWLRSISPAELQLLSSSEMPAIETTDSQDNLSISKPVEMLLYEELRSKFHQTALIDKLRIMLSPDLRQKYINYISDRASISEYKSLIPENLELASSMSIANLYRYFKITNERNLIHDF